MYLLDEILPSPNYAKIKKLCKNNHNLCSSWAAFGECVTDPKYMLYECPLACRSCGHLDVDIRCPVNYDSLEQQNIWKPNDLHKMFINITTPSSTKRKTNTPYHHAKKYQPKTVTQPIHSPSLINNNDCSHFWILSFEKFLTNEECDRMIQLAEEEGYDRTNQYVEEGEIDEDDDEDEEEGDDNYDKYYLNLWCDKCDDDPMMQNIIKRIEKITNIKSTHYETIQIFKYLQGQYHIPHTDHVYARADGPRILTFMFYLNDVVDPTKKSGGGTTIFTNIKHSHTNIKPKKGKAILYPNVYNVDPMEDDECSMHTSTPITHGVKQVAYVWIHIRDYKNVSTECMAT